MERETAERGCFEIERLKQVRADNRHIGQLEIGSLLRCRHQRKERGSRPEPEDWNAAGKEFIDILERKSRE